MLNLVNHLQTKLRSICQNFLNTMTIDRLLVKMYFVTIFVTILFCYCVLILLLLYFVILIKKSQTKLGDTLNFKLSLLSPIYLAKKLHFSRNMNLFL